MKLFRVLGLACLAFFLAPGVVGVQAKDAPRILFSNRADPPLESVPFSPTFFTLDQEQRIVSIRTLHWNNGEGAPQGTILLKGPKNTFFGPFAARIVDSFWWEADVNLVLSPGKYQIIDSQPATWSRNPAFNSTGVAEVTAAPAKEAVAAPHAEKKAETAGGAADSPPASTHGAQTGADATQTAADTPQTQPAQTPPDTAQTEPARPADSDASILPKPDKPPYETLDAQMEKANQLMTTAADLDENSFAAIEKCYLEIIFCCPDTPQVHEAYFRLSNLYRFGFDPPELRKNRALLEKYLQLHPDTPLSPEFRQRLLNAYQDTGIWNKAAALLESGLKEMQPGEGDYTALLLSYANCLEAAGDGEKARAAYVKLITAASRSQGDLDAMWADVARDNIRRLDLSAAGNWTELAKMLQKEMDNIPLPDMAHIHSLFLYATALEKTGNAAGAKKAYEQVLAIDQHVETRQGKTAQERLKALGGG